MGCGVTLTRDTFGAAPVTAPVESTGNTTWAMNTFQAWPDWLLGSTFLFDPYHTASARPGPPALIHGNTLTASPVPVDPSLTRTGAVQVRHPLFAEAALTKICRCDGVSLSIAHTTKRLRALSRESTVNSTSGEPGRLSATWIRPPALPLGWAASGASRKCRSPVASGVPMFSMRSYVPSPLGSPAVSNTFPVCWSMAGYPSDPKGLYTASLAGVVS